MQLSSLLSAWGCPRARSVQGTPVLVGGFEGTLPHVVAQAGMSSRPNHLEVLVRAPELLVELVGGSMELH
jgi:hypothetical protein